MANSLVGTGGIIRGVDNTLTGIFGKSGSSSSTSDTHAWTWNSSDIENFMDQFDPEIWWENKTISPMNNTMRNVLDYMESGQAINNGKSVLGWGGNAFKSGISRLEKEAGVTPEAYFDAMQNGAKSIYSDFSGALSTADTNIENNVYANMGSEFANNAQKQMGGQSVAGSSAMNNSAMSILASGENSVATQEMKLNAEAMAEALGISGNLASGYARGYSALTKEALGIGKGAMSAGAKIINTGMKNEWNAGLVDQLAAQLNSNNNRRNNMISNNLPLVDDLMWLSAELQTSGIDTNTHSESTTSSSGGSWF